MAEEEDQTDRIKFVEIVNWGVRNHSFFLFEALSFPIHKN
jgi:hypothetical protein